MTEELKYRKVVPCGALIIGDESYFLLSPEPLPKRWEEDAIRYLVTPEMGTYYKESGATVYPCARHVVVHGDHHIEYIPRSTPILVKDMGDDDVLNYAIEEHYEQE